MKRLICAALVAGSMMAMADEAAKCEGGKCAVPAAAPAAAAPVATAIAPAARPKMTPDERRKMREQIMAERKAAMEAKMLEVVKKYVPEEEKAKALIQDLQEAMAAGRRNMMMRRPIPKAAKPAEAAK